MKLFKYISALALGAVALTSCSSDDSEDKSYNTASGVGVSMGQAEMFVNEAKGIFKVPVVVTGNANGYVSVTVKITGTNDGKDQAIADSHFYVTSRTIYIPKDSKEGNIEIRTQELPERDNDRYFNVVIESAEGATVEPLNTTTICIQDRMSSPIYQLSGPWTLSYNDTGEPTTVKNVQFNVINDQTGECEFVAFAPGLYSGINLPVIYREDPVSGEWKMSIPLGETLATVSFTGLGECDVRIGDSTGKLSGELPGVWSDDHSSIIFKDGFYLFVFSEGTNVGYWAAFTDFVGTPQF